MNYIIVGDTAYVSDFYGDMDELINHFPDKLVNALRLKDVKKVVWGLEGEYWEYLEDFPVLVD